jgi:hypothetical protein
MQRKIQRAKIIVALTIKEVLKYITINSNMSEMFGSLHSNKQIKKAKMEGKKEGTRETGMYKQRKINIKTQRYVGGRTK